MYKLYNSYIFEQGSETRCVLLDRAAIKGVVELTSSSDAHFGSQPMSVAGFGRLLPSPTTIDVSGFWVRFFQEQTNFSSRCVLAAIGDQ